MTYVRLGQGCSYLHWGSIWISQTNMTNCRPIKLTLRTILCTHRTLNNQFEWLLMYMTMLVSFEPHIWSCQFVVIVVKVTMCSMWSTPERLLRVLALHLRVCAFDIEEHGILINGSMSKQASDVCLVLAGWLCCWYHVATASYSQVVNDTVWRWTSLDEITSWYWGLERTHLLEILATYPCTQLCVV